MTAARIHRLSALELPQLPRGDASTSTRTLVVLVGPNGAGKTNLIEAISFLAPGRGLRRATLEEVRVHRGRRLLGGLRRGRGHARARRRSAPASKRRAARGRDAARAGAASTASRCRPPRAFADHLSIVWLTPAMDGLFSGPASERRRFLDRLVLAVDGTHTQPRQRAGALAALAQSAARDSRTRTRTGSTRSSTRPPRSRSRLRPRAPRLCGALRRCWRDRDAASPFPWAGIALNGWMENALMEQPATDVEDRYRAVLRDNRARDAAAGRTTRRAAPHRPRRALRRRKASRPPDASTGEQKALLIGPGARACGRWSPR